MKKLILLALGVCCIAALPLSAAEKRENCVKRVESCEAIIREFMATGSPHAIPKVVLDRARAIVITNQFEAGVIFGMRGGYGVILARKPGGEWSIPVLIRAGEASVGFQLGGKAVETVYIMTDDATPRMLFKNRFNVGVDANAVAGPHWAEAEAINQEVLNTPVLVYTKTKGLMAGATVKTGYMSRNDEANRVLHKTSYTMPELLYGDFVECADEAKPLMDYITQIAPPAAK
ncbi:MAG: lipid-binding SYLF domain-containing protein [Opitutaceae bacterium]|jgi:lipid-binding SYLF domain-containing protein|nr:lipid-binding SYLF domain-containing protein [Opitutaceae bacterium]